MCRRFKGGDVHTVPMSRYLRFFWSVALSTLAAGAAAAGVMAPSHAPVLLQFTTAQGLPLDSVNDVLQTRDGYLWAGTFGGLARFDGSRFTPFPAHRSVSTPEGGPARAEGPPSNRITALLEDSQGRLWIGTEDSGIGILSEGHFLHLDTCQRACQVNQLFEHGDVMWTATDMGLWRVDVHSLEGRRVGTEAPTLTSLTIDAQGAVWVTAESWLARVAGEHYQWTDQPPELRDINQVLVDGDELLVASGLDLFSYRPRTAVWRRWNIGAIQRLNPMPDGRILASMRDGRVLRLSADMETEQVTDLKLMRPFNIIRDRDGSLWITTAAEGLVRVREPWIGTLNAPDLRMAAPARAIAPDGRGGYWFTFNCDGLRRWHADGTLEDWTDRLPPSWRCLETLHRGPSGMLWIGSSGGGVMRMDAAAGTDIREVRRWRGQLPVYALYENADGSLLVAVRRETRRLVFRPDGIVSDTAIAALDELIVRQIVPSRRGGLWFVGNHGALRLQDDVVQERWTPEQGLSSRFARALHEDTDGNLWIGTYGGGLNRIRDGRIDVYTRANGLSDDTISCILEDSRGRLWLAGNRGVAVMDPAAATPTSVRTRAFDAGDGLVPPEINGGNQASCLLDSDGRIWLSLVRGFAMIDPDRLDAAPALPPPVHIEHVAVAGSPRDPRQPLALSPGARSIEIGYAAIEFLRPEHLQFRFRLSGLSEAWTMADGNRSIVYPTLPWGDYRFQVQARREGEPWPATWAELPISHTAPWYQRPWVWLLTTLLALVLLLDTGWQRSPSAASPRHD